jgi:flagellum-specific peptidoglycan hydrolase FlgJ
VKPSDFITEIAPAAQASMLANPGVLASITIAQAAVESSWGESELTLNANNLFGIKADPSWTGPSFKIMTGEYVDGHEIMVPASFRQYASWQESINDHAAFLLGNPRYAAVLHAKNAASYAIALQSCGYSTNPGYAKLLMEIINFHDLTSFDTPNP